MSERGLSRPGFGEIEIPKTHLSEIELSELALEEQVVWFMRRAYGDTTYHGMGIHQPLYVPSEVYPNAKIRVMTKIDRRSLYIEDSVQRWGDREDRPYLAACLVIEDFDYMSDGLIAGPDSLEAIGVLQKLMPIADKIDSLMQEPVGDTVGLLLYLEGTFFDKEEAAKLQVWLEADERWKPNREAQTAGFAYHTIPLMEQPIIAPHIRV